MSGGQESTSRVADDRHRARVLDALPQIVVVLDDTGVITMATGRPPRGVELDVAALVGRHVADVVHPDDLEAVLGVLPSQDAHAGDVVGPMAFRYFDDAGNERVVEGLAWDRLQDPEIQGVVIVLRDIVGPHLVEQALADLAAGEDMTSIGGSIVRAAAEPPLDAVGLVLADGVPRDERLVAASPVLVDGSDLVDLLAGWDPLTDGAGALTHDPTLATASHELRARVHALGLRAAIVVPVEVRGQDEPPLRLVVLCSWVQPPSMNQARLLERHARVLGLAYERLHLEEQLVHAAEHDALTGLPNRMGFLRWAEHAQQRRGDRGRRHDEASCAVLFLDLDGFKAVNDRLGHPSGDEVLVAVARRLAANVRDLDVVARLGGDEFVVVLHDARTSEALELSERLVAAVGRPIELAETTVLVAASIGVAVGAPEDLDQLLERADQAMYAAKGDAVDQVQLAPAT